MTKAEVLSLMKAVELLKSFFNNDEDKVALLLTLDNPLLGETPPISFFLRGRGYKVLNFIETSLQENTIDE